MALSTLCKNSKISLSIAFWLLLFTFSIYIYFLSNRLSDIVENKNTTQYFTIGYILPNFSFGIILAEFYIKGGAQSIFNLDIATAWLALGLSIPFYTCLYLYLDGIVLNSYGERKNYLFCLKSSNKKVKKLREPGESSSDDEEILETIVKKVKVQDL